MSENTTNKHTTPQDATADVNEMATPLLDTLVKYKNVIAGAVIAVVAVAAIYTGVTLWNSYSVNSAKDQLGDILLTTSGEERAEALRAFAKDAPDAVLAGTLFELAAVQMRLGDYGAASETWSRIAETMENPELQTVARLGNARALLLGEKPAEALAEANRLQTEAPEGFATPVNRIIAAAAEQAGDTEAALAAYQALLAGGQAADAEYIQYKIGQLQAAE